MNKGKSRIQTFEDLEVWKLAKEIRNDIFRLVKKFPKNEKYRSGDQIIRSSRSITDNVSEERGHFYYQENIQFCRILRGSLSELKNDIYTVYEKDYINKKKRRTTKVHIEECNHILNGYIRYLKKTKKKFKTEKPNLIYETETDNR